MELTDKEKELLRYLVKTQLEILEKEASKVQDIAPAFLAAESRYDDFLKKLLHKL